MKRTLLAVQLLTLLFLTAACPKRSLPVKMRPQKPHRVEAASPPPDPGPARDEETEARVRETLAAVDRMLTALVDRPLTERERDDRDAAAAFVVQAVDALHAGDAYRASVLAEKARALVESVAQATEP